MAKLTTIPETPVHQRQAPRPIHGENRGEERGEGEEAADDIAWLINSASLASPELNSASSPSSASSSISREGSGSRNEAAAPGSALANRTSLMATFINKAANFLRPSGEVPSPSKQQQQERGENSTELATGTNGGASSDASNISRKRAAPAGANSRGGEILSSANNASAGDAVHVTNTSGENNTAERERSGTRSTGRRDTYEFPEDSPAKPQRDLRSRGAEIHSKTTKRKAGPKPKPKPKPTRELRREVKVREQVEEALNEEGNAEDEGILPPDSPARNTRSKKRPRDAQEEAEEGEEEHLAPQKKAKKQIMEEVNEENERPKTPKKRGRGRPPKKKDLVEAQEVEDNYEALDQGKTRRSLVDMIDEVLDELAGSEYENQDVESENDEEHGDEPEVAEAPEPGPAPSQSARRSSRKPALKTKVPVASQTQGQFSKSNKLQRVSKDGPSGLPTLAETQAPSKSKSGPSTAKGSPKKQESRAVKKRKRKSNVPDSEDVLAKKQEIYQQKLKEFEELSRRNKYFKKQRKMVLLPPTGSQADPSLSNSQDLSRKKEGSARRDLDSMGRPRRLQPNSRIVREPTVSREVVANSSQRMAPLRREGSALLSGRVVSSRPIDDLQPLDDDEPELAVEPPSTPPNRTPMRTEIRQIERDLVTLNEEKEEIRLREERLTAKLAAAKEQEKELNEEKEDWERMYMFGSGRRGGKDGTARRIVPWTMQEMEVLVEGLMRETGRERYQKLVPQLPNRNFDEIVARAKAFRATIVAADELAERRHEIARRKLEPWLESVGFEGLMF